MPANKVKFKTINQFQKKLRLASPCLNYRKYLEYRQLQRRNHDVNYHDKWSGVVYLIYTDWLNIYIANLVLEDAQNDV